MATLAIGRRLGLAAAVLGVIAAAAAQVRANPLPDLSGRWSGGGMVTMSNGNSERIKCNVVWAVSGRSIQHNLRCASTSYKINAQADLSLAGSQLSGNWNESNYSATGTVAGRLTTTGMSLSIQGLSFAAAMAVTTTKCKQTIRIAPSGLEIAKVTLGLSKC